MFAAIREQHRRALWAFVVGVVWEPCLGLLRMLAHLLIWRRDRALEGNMPSYGDGKLDRGAQAVGFSASREDAEFQILLRELRYPAIAYSQMPVDDKLLTAREKCGSKSSS